MQKIYEESISVHETRESARMALIDMSEDINYENLIIKEVMA